MCTTNNFPARSGSFAAEKNRLLCGRRSGCLCVVGVAVELDLFDVSAAEVGKLLFFAEHIADVHILILCEGHADDARAFEIAREESAGDGVGVGADEDVDEAAGVAELDALIGGELAVELFGEMRVVVAALHEIDARIILQVFEAEAALVCEGMVCADEDLWLDGKEGIKGELAVFEGFADGELVVAADVDDAEVTEAVFHVVEDLVHGGFVEDELEAFFAKFVDDIDKGVGCEHIMRAGHGEADLAGGVGDVFILQKLHLMQHLARIADELHAFRRDDDAGAAADKDGDADFFLDVFDGVGQARLGNI